MLGGSIVLRRSIILLTLVLASIGFAQESELRWNASDWESMDPAYITLQQESAIAMNIYNGLVNWEYGSTEIVPDLAQSWDISEDGTVYTFHLRQGVMWQKDYGELTAQDVKFTFDRILNPATSAPLASTYSIINSVDIIDDYTVQFTLNEPYAPFLLLLVPYKAGGIVNQQALKEFGDDYGLNPIGTGPFQWVEGDPRGEIVLEAFDNYYAGRPNSTD